jgi:uncharacterized membrane protein YagU involved in acid resistance
MASTSLTRNHLRPWQWIVIGGLVAGALDILYAMAYWQLKAGVSPARILQSVAAGLIGKEQALAGDHATAALGAVLHFGIALAMAYAYYAASDRLRALARRPVFYGALYGLLLYAIMNYVVVPLSAAGPPPSSQPASWLVLSIAAHVVLVGIPCALASSYARRA